MYYTRVRRVTGKRTKIDLNYQTEYPGTCIKYIFVTQINKRNIIVRVVCIYESTKVADLPHTCI